MSCLQQAQVLCITLASPTPEVAFVLAAGYTTVSNLSAGALVSIPNLGPNVNFLPYISMIRYPYQAAILNFFKDNEKAIIMPGMTVGDYVELIKLNVPPTIWQNLLIALGFYCTFVLGGFLCLKYLYKERR